MTKRSEARFGGPFPSAALLICFGLAASAFAHGKDPVPNTRRLDAEIRDFFVSRVAPALEGALVTR